MISDFQRAKLERRFELLDADGDGHITANDYDIAAANVCRAFGFHEDSPQYEKVHVAYLRLWAALSRRTDQQQTGRVSREQFVDACARAIVEAEEGYDRIIGPIALNIFEIIDADDSGTLDIEELSTWFNTYGVCLDDAERAFRAVDRNGDGLLDAREVQKAIREFYTSDDPQAPGNLIFGPLPVAARAAGGNGSGNGSRGAAKPSAEAEAALKAAGSNGSDGSNRPNGSTGSKRKKKTPATLGGQQ